MWRRSFFTDAQLPLLLPAQKAAAVAAFLYVLLAEFGVPAQRTLYMLAVVAAALWFGRIASVSHVLCSALGVVVVLDPWAVLWPGFWLSFTAVAVILYASEGRLARTGQSRWIAALGAGARTQYAVTLGLVPFLMVGKLWAISSCGAFSTLRNLSCCFGRTTPAMSNNCFRAIHRFDSANRVTTCAVFLAGRGSAPSRARTGA